VVVAVRGRNPRLFALLLFSFASLLGKAPDGIAEGMRGLFQSATIPDIVPGRLVSRTGVSAGQKATGRRQGAPLADDLCHDATLVGAGCGVVLVLVVFDELTKGNVSTVIGRFSAAT
jgi:hypothetical protein